MITDERDANFSARFRWPRAYLDSAYIELCAPATCGEDVVRISRRISVNHEFNVFNRLYFSAAAFPGIASAPLPSLDGANLKQLLGTEGHMPVTEMRQRVSFVVFGDEASGVLEVPPGTRGMLLESAAMAGRQPLYFFESFIPPNERRLDVS